MVQIPRLREWREARALTQVELAERAGISSRSVAGYEAGTGARLPTIRRLAGALGIEPADLYGEVDSPLGQAPPSHTQPPLNGFEEERREVIYQRAWRDFITRLANRYAAEADNKGYAPEWILEISEIPRDLARVLFDNGVIGKRETYPTEAELHGSWEIDDALQELNRAVERAWRTQMKESEQLEQRREAAAELPSILKRFTESKKRQEKELEAIRNERRDSA